MKNRDCCKIPINRRHSGESRNPEVFSTEKNWMPDQVRHDGLKNPRFATAANNVYEKGFTLVELMIVVIILSTLAAMIIPRFAGRSEESKRAAARADVEANIGNALDMFELDTGKYPAKLDDLINPPSDVDSAKWKGPYVKKKQFLDPWGNVYQYRCPGTVSKDYDLFSMGPNGIAGDNDDIGNWEQKTGAK